MKNILKYTLSVLFVASLASCTTEKVQYDFQANPGPHVTFQSDKLKLPGVTEEDNNKLFVPLYRANLNGEATVAVALDCPEGLLELASETVTFKDGESVAQIELNYDYSQLTAKPESVTLSIVDEKDLAFEGYASTTFSFVKYLNYELVGTGYYYSYAFGDWEQDVYKAEGEDYYRLPDCWAKGTDFLFYCDGETVEWYTEDTGFAYASYGNLFLDVESAEVFLNDDGLYEVFVNVPSYYLPEDGDSVLIPDGYEGFIFPEGFEFD